MTNPDIQRELLMETRTAQQVLQFALNRERGQENQKAINSQLNRYFPYASEQISNFTTSPRNTSFNPDHDHPYGTPRLKDPQSPQTPADAAEYSFQSSTCKFAQPKKSSATYAKKLHITVKCADQQNSCGKHNK